MPTTPSELKTAFGAGKYPSATNYSDLIDYIGTASGATIKTIAASEDTSWNTLVDGVDLTGATLVLVTVESGVTSVKITYQDNGSGQTSWINLVYGDAALFTPDGQAIVVDSSINGHTIINMSQTGSIAEITDIFTYVQNGKVVFLQNTAATAVNVTDANSNVLCSIQPNGIAQFIYAGSNGWKLVGVPIQ